MSLLSWIKGEKEQVVYCNSHGTPTHERPEVLSYPVPPRPLSEEERRTNHLRKLQEKINPVAMLKIGEELAKDDKITFEKLVSHYQGISNDQINTAAQLAFSVAYDKPSFMKYFKFFYEGYL